MAFSKEELATLGGRFSTQRILEQIPVSVLTARVHETALGSMFPSAKVDELETYETIIAELFASQSLKKLSVSTANVSVQEAMHDVKEGIRIIVTVADNTFEEEPNIRDRFHQGPLGRSVAAIIRKAERILGLAEENFDALTEWGLKRKTLENTRKAIARLTTENIAQETTLKNLPPVTKKLYQEKGKAYLLLKRLARTGRRCFAGDPAVAAQFRLDILTSKGRRRRDDTEDDGEAAFA